MENSTDGYRYAPNLHFEPIHRMVDMRKDKWSPPCDVCSECSDFETGYLVPVSFCEEAMKDAERIYAPTDGTLFGTRLRLHRLFELSDAKQANSLAKRDDRGISPGIEPGDAEAAEIDSTSA